MESANRYHVQRRCLLLPSNCLIPFWVFVNRVKTYYLLEVNDSALDLDSPFHEMSQDMNQSNCTYLNFLMLGKPCLSVFLNFFLHHYCFFTFLHSSLSLIYQQGCHKDLIFIVRMKRFQLCQKELLRLIIYFSYKSPF